MISKETFVNTMDRLEALDDKMHDVDFAFQKLSPNFCGFYIPEVLNIVMDLLEDLLDNKYEFLEYCVYERDFLHDMKLGHVTDENGDPVDLSSWDKVYDFLIENKEE